MDSRLEGSGSEFLVGVRVDLPPDMSEHRRGELLRAEYECGVELMGAGTLRGIWRIPGALANVAIWHVADATELHELLTGLPLAPWMNFDVTALATHPVAAANSEAGDQNARKEAGT